MLHPPQKLPVAAATKTRWQKIAAITDNDTVMRNGEVVTEGNPTLLAVARSGCLHFRDSHRIIRLMLA